MHGSCRRRGPAGAPDPLRGLQGLQRAERPGVLARPGNHEHRPATLDGLRRRARLRHDERADQGDQGRRGRPPLSPMSSFWKPRHFSGSGGTKAHRPGISESGRCFEANRPYIGGHEADAPDPTPARRRRRRQAQDHRRAVQRGRSLLAGVAFERNLANKFALQKLSYPELRDRFGLSAQMAMRCIAKSLKRSSGTRTSVPRFASTPRSPSTTGSWRSRGSTG